MLCSVMLCSLRFPFPPFSSRAGPGRARPAAPARPGAHPLGGDHFAPPWIPRVEQIAYKTKSKLRILGFRGIQIESLEHLPISEIRIGKWRNRVGKRRLGFREMLKNFVISVISVILRKCIPFEENVYEIGKPRRQERGKSLQKGCQWIPRFAFGLTIRSPFCDFLVFLKSMEFHQNRIKVYKMQYRRRPRFQ